MTPAAEPGWRGRTSTRPSPGDGVSGYDARPLQALPPHIRAADGHPFTARSQLVEVPGIEPGSSVALRGLLRAQSALPLLGSTGHADKPV